MLITHFINAAAISNKIVDFVWIRTYSLCFDANLIVSLDMLCYSIRHVVESPYSEPFYLLSCPIDSSKKASTRYLKKAMSILTSSS